MSDLLSGSGDKPKKVPSKPSKRRMSPALSRVAQRSLAVTDDEIRTFQPLEIDLAIIEAMLSGALLQKDIAAEIKVDPSTISKRLMEPVVCRFIANMLHKSIAHRLGMVDVAMLNRAVLGDVPAAKVLYQRYGEMVQRSQHVNVTTQIPFDPSVLSNDELDAVILSKGTAAGAPIDVTPIDPETPEDG